MKNVSYEVKGDKLFITVDLKAQRSPSKSGKTAVLASTEGNIEVEGTDLKLGVNCYGPKA